MSSFDEWEQEFRPGDEGRTLVLPPLPRRAVTASVRHRGAELRAERRRHRAEWLWGMVGGVVAAAPVLAVVWMQSGR